MKEYRENAPNSRSHYTKNRTKYFLCLIIRLLMLLVRHAQIDDGQHHKDKSL